MPEEKKSTVSNETVDNVEKKTSYVVSKEVLSMEKKEGKSLGKINHPDPGSKGSITAMEEVEMEEEKDVGFGSISTVVGDKKEANILPPRPNVDKSTVLRVENDTHPSNLVDVSTGNTKDANKKSSSR